MTGRITGLPCISFPTSSRSVIKVSEVEPRYYADGEDADAMTQDLMKMLISQPQSPASHAPIGRQRPCLFPGTSPGLQAQLR